jgi:MFS family permease
MQSLLTSAWAFRNFILYWLGQSLSQVGTALTGFGLGVWVYQQTGAVTQLSLVFFITTLPGVLLTPFIGALVDRWNRRWIIFFSDLGGLLITFVLVLMLMTHQLEIWHTYISAFFTSLCGCFHFLAKGAALPMLVPKQHLSRANGLLHLSTAVSRIAAPIMAGFLISVIGLESLLWLDLGSYVIGLVSILFVTIPQPDTSLKSSDISEKTKSFFPEIAAGWQIISSSPGLVTLVALMSLHSFVDMLTDVLINPLILSFSTTQILGIILSVGGIGMIIGSLSMSILNNQNRVFSSLIGWSAVNGVGLIIVGLKPSVLTVSLGVFIWFLTLPFIFGTNQTIWQTFVDSSFHGRVLSLVGSVTGFAGALGTISASPLADILLEPSFVENHFLAHTVGQFFSIGKGRGIGFLISLEGMLILLVSIGLYAYTRYSHLEESWLTVED